MTARTDLASTSTARAPRDACRRLHRALEAGRIGLARRLVRPASRMVRRRPRLAERLTQRALAAGEPSIALAIADACREPTESLRALRRVCLAELDASAAGGPDDQHASGRRLAARQVRAGAPCSAARTLRQLTEKRESLDALLLLVILSHAREAGDTTRRWLDRARATTGSGGDAAVVSILSESLGIPVTATSGPTPETDAVVLAVELERDGRAIEALTELAARTGDRHAASLLTQAVERVMPRLAAPGPAATAVARMMLRLGDPQTASAWARRVLETDRLSVASARLLHECNEAIYRLDRRRAMGREAA